MSTKADIVEQLRYTAGNLINETMEDGGVSSFMLIDAADQIEQLRAERDALHKSYQLAVASRLEWRRIAERAARDMRERCALEAEQHGSAGEGSRNNKRRLAIAAEIRALPTTVIATEGKTV